MHDSQVFISYKSEDVDQAQWLRSMLETNGISCWMAPASIPGGSNYAKEIPQAIDHCRVFVLVLTKRCQNSIWVPKELDRALNAQKPVMPFVLENCRLNDDFNFYLSNVQRYEAYQNKANAAQQLLRDIRALLDVPYQPPKAPPKVKKQLPKFTIKWIVAAIAVVLGVLTLPLLGYLGLERVDAFQDLEITVQGAAPYGSVVLENRSPDPFVRSISYTATPDSGLREGDCVTITADISKEAAKEAGYRLESHTMQYTVEDLPSYIENPSALSAADVAQLKEKAEMVIRGKGIDRMELHQENGQTRDLSPDEIAACYQEFVFLDNGYVCADQNALIVPFRIRLEDVPCFWVDNVYYDEPVPVDFPALYGYVSFPGLMLDQDGNLISGADLDLQFSGLFESTDGMNVDILQKYPDSLIAGNLANNGQ